MTKLSMFFIGIFIILLAAVYYPWFVNASIIGGDWPYFFDETIQALPLFPPGWSGVHGNGLGGVIPGYFLDQYLYFTAFLSSHVLNIPWEVGYKALWFGTFLALSVFSSMYLVKTVFVQVKSWQMALAALIFTTNTYILMVVGGGQMGVALAYSTAPLVLASFIKITDVILSSSRNIKYQISNIKYAIIAGLILAAQVMFDPRIAYLSMIAVALYYIINKFQISSRQGRDKFQIVAILYIFAIPGVIAVLLHASWIAPLLLSGHNPIVDLGTAIPTVAGLKFFSFASFSQTLSFLHPNWPENIFGKIYFMKPEFLILPVLTYGSLFFIKNSKSEIRNPKQYQNSKYKIQNNLTIEQFNNRTILFFALLGLIGAFLAKGANPPFGEVNTWLFQYIPGMNMFRDPTKFYVLIALSYSVLIPFSVYSVYKWLKLNVTGSVILNSVQDPTGRSRNKFGMTTSLLFLIFTISFLIFLIRPALFGQLGGTFKHHDVPKEYIELKDFLHSKPDFFRTLWVPRQQRFTFVSNIHPAIEAMPLFEATNSSQIVSRLQESESQRLLEELSVKYVIIPYDSLGEIFLQDRKYDEQQYKNIIKELGKISWLKRIDGFGKLAVFETHYHKDLFWLHGSGNLSYSSVNSTKYMITVSGTTDANLIFSQNYSPFWIAKKENDMMYSQKTKDGLNSFSLKKAQNSTFTVYYLQDQYYWYGRVISIGVLLLWVLFLIKPWIHKNIIKRFRIPEFF